MLNAVIPGATRAMAKDQPEYLTLHIRDEVFEDGTPVMTAQYEFTPSEVAAVQAGAPLMLSVLGTQWQPARPWVGTAPEPVASVVTVPGAPASPVTIREAAAALQAAAEGRDSQPDSVWLAQTFHNACLASGLTNREQVYRFLSNFLVGLQVK